MFTEKLMQYFNKQPRLGSMSTAGKDGKVDVAFLGSPRMLDEKTVLMGLGRNRTFANLQENPYAVYMIMEPAASLPEWKGVRVYLKLASCETEGAHLDQIKAEIAKKSGENAAKMMQAAVLFDVLEVRPIVDFGQDWEKSI